MVVPIFVFFFTRKMHNFYFSFPVFFYKTIFFFNFLLDKMSSFLISKKRHFILIVYCILRK